MEKNSPETVVKPTLAERIRIFMQYADQSLYLKGKGHGEYMRGPAECYYMPEHNVFSGKISFCRGYTAFAHELSIEVKPMSKISDEDKRAVYALTGFHSADSDLTKHIQAEVLLKFFLEGKNTGAVSGLEWQRIIDFLRARGYALPYKGWSVEELVGFGIFKIIE